MSFSCIRIEVRFVSCVVHIEIYALIKICTLGVTPCFTLVEVKCSAASYDKLVILIYNVWSRAWKLW